MNCQRERKKKKKKVLDFIIRIIKTKTRKRKTVAAVQLDASFSILNKHGNITLCPSTMYQYY